MTFWKMSECLSTVFAYYGGDWIFSIEHNDVVYFDVDDHRYNDGRDYDDGITEATAVMLVTAMRRRA